MCPKKLEINHLNSLSAKCSASTWQTSTHLWNCQQFSSFYKLRFLGYLIETVSLSGLCSSVAGFSRNLSSSYVPLLRLPAKHSYSRVCMLCNYEISCPSLLSTFMDLAQKKHSDIRHIKFLPEILLSNRTHLSLVFWYRPP